MTNIPSPQRCSHQWQRVHEEMLFGGSSVLGYRCKICRQFIPLCEMTPAGLGGISTGEEVLHGPCGGNGSLSDGTPYREQIVYPDGRLEILRPLGWREDSKIQPDWEEGRIGPGGEK